MGFVPYQVDYSAQNTAKTLGFTKKKVAFKFGFANPQSLRSGATGAACRGSEHELVFLWSLKSGKRQLFLDGRDVHFSESGQNGWTADRAWQHAFTMKDATGTYRVHFISQPKNPDLPDSKPFDMRVAGVSYFAFNRIFQLGTPTMIVRENNRDGGSPRHRSGRDSPMTPEERRLVAAAKVESLRDMQKQQQTSSRRSPSPEAPPKLPREEPNLLSFDDPTPPPPPPAAMVGSGGYNQFASSVTLDASFTAPPNQQAPSPYGQPGPYGQPPAPYGGGYDRQPSYGQSTSMAQLPYGQAPPPQQQQSYSSYGSSFPGMTPAPVPYSDPSSSLALAPYQAPTVSTEPAPSPYAMPLSTPTSSYASNYQQQQQQPPQPSFASPGGQSYVSYGSAPSFAQPPSQQPQPQFATPSAVSSPPSTYGDVGGYSSMPPQPPAPMPMQSTASGGGSYYGAPQPQPPAPMQQPGSFYAPPAPAPAPYGDMSASQYYAGNASAQQLPPQPQQPYGGGGGYPQQYPSY
jgi:hypothetical protein